MNNNFYLLVTLLITLYFFEGLSKSFRFNFDTATNVPTSIAPNKDIQKKNIRAFALAAERLYDHDIDLIKKYHLHPDSVGKCQDYWSVNNITIGDKNKDQGIWFVNHCWLYTNTGWLNASKINWNSENRRYYSNDYWACKNNTVYSLYYPEDCTWVQQNLPF